MGQPVGRRMQSWRCDPSVLLAPVHQRWTASSWSDDGSMLALSAGVAITSSRQLLSNEGSTDSRAAVVCAEWAALALKADKKRGWLNRQPPFLRVFRQRPTLPLGVPAVPSALEGLTSVFGMGTGVAPPPLPPETKFSHNCIRETEPKSARSGDENRVVKPHGRLVPVSSTHCCAFTPGLSTS
jgi:hypothetical protein